MSATTYEQTTYRHADHGRMGNQHGFRPAQAAKAAGDAVLNWLGRVGERSAAGRAAASYQRLNAMSDSELAHLGLTRDELVARCFGWRGLY